MLKILWKAAWWCLLNSSTYTPWPSNSTPRCVSAEVRSLYLPKDKFENVHSNTIYNNPNLETTQMPINNTVEEWIYCNIFIQRNKQTMPRCNYYMDESHKHNDKWKTLMRRVHIVLFHLNKVQKQSKLIIYGARSQGSDYSSQRSWLQGQGQWRGGGLLKCRRCLAFFDLGACYISYSHFMKKPSCFTLIFAHFLLICYTSTKSSFKKTMFYSWWVNSTIVIL